VAEVVEVALFEDDETCSGLIFKRKHKDDVGTGNALLAPPPLTISQCMKAEGKVFGRRPVGLLCRPVLLPPKSVAIHPS